MSGADLFTWRDEADAAERVAELEAQRAAARRARSFAPHGQVRTREEKLQAATLDALRAEVELARLRRREQPR